MNQTPPDEATRQWIRPLPAQVVNKIAAGEVIERPAAVVKELVENAIDAGATRIDIIVEKSGVKCIKVVDNGCGIPEEQIEIAFARHATSKISRFNDLDSLHTYGFRGEALPSIASVSRLRMVSRAANEQAGTEIIFEGGVLQSCQPAPAPPGTTVEVENLFFNTPGRRKFLKAESTEARHISRTATALAMGCPDIGFSYTANSRKVFSVPSGLGLKERVAGLLGADKRFVAVNGEAGPVKVNGYLGLPDSVQNNRYGQFLFVNSRYVFSPVLSHALTAAYGELIPRGTYPVGALLLTVDPGEVDVNVHPSKTEVRLSREREVHDAVIAIIKDSLHHDGIIPSFRGTHEAARPSRADGSPVEPAIHGGTNNVIPGIGQGEPADVQFLDELYRQPPLPGSSAETEKLIVDKETGEVLRESADVSTSIPPREESAMPFGFRLVGRFSDLYLLVQAGDDLYIVDQHTAHERVLYEETVRSMDTNSANGQNLLFPVQVELSPEQLAVFEESLDLFGKTGFAVSHFGGRVVSIEATPAILANKAPETKFLKVLDDIASLRKMGCDLKKAMAQSIACRSAVMAGDRLTDEEATHLLTRLYQCRDKYSCPHGRPTFIKITRKDLDRQFGRG